MVGERQIWWEAENEEVGEKDVHEDEPFETIAETVCDARLCSWQARPRFEAQLLIFLCGCSQFQVVLGNSGTSNSGRCSVLKKKKRKKRKGLGDPNDLAIFDSLSM